MICFALQPERMTLLSVADSKIQAMGLKPFSEPLTPEALLDAPACVERVSAAFTSLCDTLGLREKDIGVVLSGAMVMVKKIPAALGLGEDRLGEIMAWEADQYLLSPLSEFVFSVQRLPFSTPSGNPLYLHVLVRKLAVQVLKSFAKQNGLSLKEIDVDLFAAARAVLANYDVDPKGTTVYAEIQDAQVVFLFIHHREYFLSHRAALPPEVSAGADPAELNALLVKELRRLVFGHRIGKGMEDLERLILAGPAVSPGMVKELNALVPTEIVAPFRRIQVEPGAAQSDAYVHFPDQFTSSLGLALKCVPTLKAGPTAAF